MGDTTLALSPDHGDPAWSAVPRGVRRYLRLSLRESVRNSHGVRRTPAHRRRLARPTPTPTPTVGTTRGPVSWDRLLGVASSPSHVSVDLGVSSVHRISPLHRGHCDEPPTSRDLSASRRTRVVRRVTSERRATSHGVPGRRRTSRARRGDVPFAREHAGADAAADGRPVRARGALVRPGPREPCY